MYVLQSVISEMIFGLHVGDTQHEIMLLVQLYIHVCLNV